MRDVAGSALDLRLKRKVGVLQSASIIEFVYCYKGFYRRARSSAANAKRRVAVVGVAKE